MARYLLNMAIISKSSLAGAGVDATAAAGAFAGGVVTTAGFGVSACTTSGTGLALSSTSLLTSLLILSSWANFFCSSCTCLLLAVASSAFAIIFSFLVAPLPVTALSPRDSPLESLNTSFADSLATGAFSATAVLILPATSCLGACSGAID